MNAIVEVGLSNALMAIALALPVAILGRVARRPALVHSLWLLVLLKLVTPPMIEVPIPRWATAAAPGPRTVDPEPRPAEDEDADRTALDPEPGEDRASGEPEVVGASPVEIDAGRPTAMASTRAAAGTPEVRRFERTDTPAIWLIGVWLAGSLAWFGRAGLRIWAFHRLLRHARPASDEMQDQARDLAGRLGLARCPGVWVVPLSVSPLLWALGGPARLILPARLMQRLGPAERASLLAHELAHLCRRDHWVRWLELVALGAYWWHPVAWWARREIERAEEQCCDAWVVRSLPGAALAYAQALLKTVDFLSEARPALPPSASGAGHVRNLRRRVTMILREPRPHRLSWPARLGAVLFAFVVLPLAPQPLEAQSDRKPEAVGEERAEEIQAKVESEVARSADRPDEGTNRRFEPLDRGQIDLAQAELQRAKDRLVWSERMREKGYRSPAQVADDKVNVQKAQLNLLIHRGQIDLAQAELQRAKDRLAWSDRMQGKGFVSPAQVADDKLALKKAELNLLYLQGASNKSLRPGTSDVAPSVVALAERAAEDERAGAESEEKGVEVRGSGEVERRLKRLEEKMDRLSSALESLGGAPREGRPKEETTRGDSLPGPRGRVEIRGRFSGASDIEKKIREIMEKATKEGFDRERMEQIRREIEEAIKKSIEPGLGKIGREFEAHIKQNFSPEHLEQVRRHLEDFAKQNLDPDHLEQIRRKMDDAAKIVEQMRRKMDDAAKSLKDQEAKLRDEEAHRDPAPNPRPRPSPVPNPRPSPDERRTAPREGPSRDRDSGDIERRLRMMEERLDRLVREMEGRGEGNLRPK